MPEAGEALATRLEARLADLQSRTQAAAARPRVLFVIWLTPLFTAGGDTFLNDLFRRAGAESVTAGLAQDWPRLSLEEVIDRDPDYLVLPRTPGLAAGLEQLAQEDPWRQLRAVRENRVVWVDEAVMRPGPRIVDAIEELSRALHAPAAVAERAQK
jgi:iron complex transport system substrate-binding protein